MEIKSSIMRGRTVGEIGNAFGNKHVRGVKE